jgi:hypothetical protein
LVLLLEICMRLAGRSIALLLVGASVGLVGATGLGSVGSDGWITQAFHGQLASSEPADEVWARSSGKPMQRVVSGDENYWLSPAGAKALTPAVQTPAVDFAPVAKGFEVGARLVLSGTGERKFDVLSVVPLPAESALADGQGRPLLLITARDVSDAGRLTRFLVEADAPGAPAAVVNKAL